VSEVVRRPFDPGDADVIDTLVAFAAAHPPTPTYPAPVRRLLTELAPPAGVLDLAWAGRRALVAAVVDRAENVHDAAILEVLGWDRVAPLGPLLAAAVPLAEEVRRAAGRAGLALPVPDVYAAVVGALGPGWFRREGSLEMERDASPFVQPPLPPRARWEDLDPDGVAEHYAVTRAAFAGDPGAFFPDPATFARASLGGKLPVRVLRCDGAEVGFARVTVEEGGRVGFIAMLGRAPAWQGRGLGAVLLAESLRVLARHGVACTRLGVTAANAAAIALYRGAGFREIAAWTTWARVS
jgi:ribosomal protein S18 acetylase RimI-like enzyme